MSEKNRTRYSILNAVSAIMLTLINGLFGIIVTRLVISYFGSDFNGLNSTANQIINVLLILEGGFTLASNVALFHPLGNEDYNIVNRVISATRKKFRKIGVIFLVVGTVVAIIYSYVVKTDLAREFVFTIIFMAVVPQAFNLFYTTTYRVLLQAQQKEYIINCFTALTIGFGHITNIVLILNNGQMWMVRFVTMVFALLSCFLITYYTRKKNDFLDFSVPSTPELIKGTNDVMAQKITGVIYTSWPIVFLSISPSGGTMLASVYAVYNNVFIMLKALLHGVIDAPRLGFGQMLTERKKDEVWPAFKEYEFVASFFTFVMMTTGGGMILPFISIYTRGITDINYYDIYIAVLMVLIGSVEMLHIPSGHILNMSGNFRISKYFQIIACALLIVSMLAFGYIWGVYGMLISLLIVAIVLAFLEIGYIHTRFFTKKLGEYILQILPFAIAGFLCAWGEVKLGKNIIEIRSFIILGIAFFLINSAVAFLIGLTFSRNETKKLFYRAGFVLKKFRV